MSSRRLEGRRRFDDILDLEDEEELLELDEERENRYQGSIVGRIKAYPRDVSQGAKRLHQDYFAENPTFPLSSFERRFRLPRPLILRLVNKLKSDFPYFQQKADAVNKTGLSTEQKVTAAIRQLAYGVCADATDEYIRIGSSTAADTLDNFCVAIVQTFASEYLRSPNESDIKRLLKQGEERGFPGMIGSIDCMHWKWKNCPVAWQGHFKGKEKSPTVVLEAVADQDLWIWHAFFGAAGANNDINILDKSPVFESFLAGRLPAIEFEVNGSIYTTPYYLADGIYPKWPVLIQSLRSPKSEKER